MPAFAALGMTTSKRVGSSGNLPYMVPSQLALVSRSVACTRLGGEAQAFVGFGPSISMASALTEQGTSQVPLNSLPSCSSAQVTLLISDCAIAEQAKRSGKNVAPIAQAIITRRNRSACCARAASGHAAAPPSSVMIAAGAHSITSSARASSVGGISRSSIRAVWALMTSSNLLAWTAGKSAGLAPLRMRPA